MKKIIISLSLCLFLSTSASAFFVSNGSITCMKPGVIDYERRFKIEWKACKAELKQINNAISFYKRQYDRCEKKNKNQTWCQEYYNKYQEYYQQLNP